MEEYDGTVRCDACGCAFPLDFETRVDGEIETTFYYNIFGQGRRAASPASFPSRA